MTKQKVPQDKKLVQIKNLVLPNQEGQKHSKLDTRCVDCISFEKGPFLYGRACKLNGIAATRPAPTCFNPDFTKLILGTNPMILHQLGFFLAQFNTSQIRILSSVINRSLTIQKYTRFHFGEEVYINMSGSREYLSNYYKGFVVGYLKANKCVFVSARMSKHRPYTSSIMVMSDTLITASEFHERAARLESEGKIQDPKEAQAAKVVLKSKGAADYEPPTLDSAPSEWLAPLHARSKLADEPKDKKRRPVMDVVDQLQKFTINT